jgi:hypothetical protein
MQHIRRRSVRIVRQAAVLNEFLKTFARRHPQLVFRGMRQLRDDVLPPYQLVLRLALGRQERAFDLYVVALGDGYPEDVQRVLSQIAAPIEEAEGHEALRVVLAPFLGEEAQALCAAANVGAMDLAGNARLEAPGLYYEVLGRENPHSRKRDVASPFRGKAERIARRLLMAGEQRWSMRALSEAAETSLGLTSMTTTALAELGAVSKSRRGLAVHDPTALLDAWAEGYDLRRNPFVIYRTRLAVEAIEGRLRDRGGEEYALTLWSGMRQLLGEAERPKTVSLFWVGEMGAVESLLQLSRRGAPNYVFVFQPYDESLLWGAAVNDAGLRVVHPLQLYLDLGSGDEQEMALAQRVREALLPY